MATGDYGDVGYTQENAPPGYHWENGRLVQDVVSATQPAGTPTGTPKGSGPIPTNPDGSQVGGGIPWDPNSSRPSYDPPGYHWDANLASFVADVKGPDTQPPTTPPPNTGGGGNYGIFSDLVKPWGGSFTSPTPTQLPTAPGFTPVPFKQAPAFSAPTLADAQNEPGFAFQLAEGNKALEHSAAAKGILNTGGTLKDIARWSQGLADTTYGNVYNRALNSYQTNYQTQYADPWKMQEQSALDAFNPQFSAWQTNTAATQRANELGYNNAWDRYSFDYNAWRNRNLDTANLILPIATA